MARFFCFYIRQNQWRMRIIFVGRHNIFNINYINSLSHEHELLCCFFLEPNRGNCSNKIKRIGKRAKKHGILKVINELCFHIFDRFYLRKNEFKFRNTKPEYFINYNAPTCPTYFVEDIHDDKWLSLIKSYSPDIIFSMCCNVIFKQILYKIPTYGTFVLHEGLCPEYKGLHTTLWALFKKEYGFIGYTLFKIDDNIDDGKILTQANYTLKHNESIKTWSWIGHNALIEGLDNIKDALRRLEKDKGFIPIDITNRNSCSYTWMTFTKFISLR